MNKEMGPNNSQFEAQAAVSPEEERRARLVSAAAEKLAKENTTEELQQRKAGLEAVNSAIEGGSQEYKVALEVAELAIVMRRELDEDASYIPSDTNLFEISEAQAIELEARAIEFEARARMLREKTAVTRKPVTEVSKPAVEVPYEQSLSMEELFGTDVFGANDVTVADGVDDLAGLSYVEREQYFAYLHNNKIEIIEYTPSKKSTSQNRKPVKDMPFTTADMADLQKMIDGNGHIPNEEVAVDQPDESHEDFADNRTDDETPEPPVKGVTAKGLIANTPSEKKTLIRNGMRATANGATKTVELSRRHPIRAVGVLAATALVVTGAVVVPKMTGNETNDTPQEVAAGEHMGNIDQLGGCIDIEGRERAAVKGQASGTVEVMLKQTDDANVPIVFGESGTPNEMNFEGVQTYVDLCAADLEMVVNEDNKLVIDRSIVKPQILVNTEGTSMTPVDAINIKQFAEQEGVDPDFIARLNELYVGTARMNYTRESARYFAEEVSSEDSVRDTYDKIIRESSTAKKQLGAWATAEDVKDFGVTFINEYPEAQVLNPEVQPSVSAYAIPGTAKVTKVEVAPVAVAEEKK